MKKFFNTLAKLEGKKSQVALGNLRETTKHIASFIVDPEKYTEEAKQFVGYLEQVHAKILKLPKEAVSILIEFRVLNPDKVRSCLDAGIPVPPDVLNAYNKITKKQKTKKK